MIKKRIHLLDEIRGFAIVLMIIYHALFSAAFVFENDTAYLWLVRVTPYEPVISVMFITLCGIVCSFSRNNRKRGIKIFAVAVGITIITRIFMEEMTIYFGILHFLGSVLFLYSFAEKTTDKISLRYGIGISLFLFVVLYNVPYRYIGIYPYPHIALPDEWYQYYWLSFLGFPSNDFASGDYFPLIPYSFLFMFGVFVGKIMKNHTLPDFVYQKHIKPLGFIGRHSLFIYLIHQPVIIGLLYILRIL